MRKIYFTLSILFLTLTSLFSQDSLYVFKDGMVNSKYSIFDIDSISFSKSLDSLMLNKNGTATTKLLISNIDSISFSPLIPSGTFRDIDGNLYTTVKIGTQTWMVENLKTTRYRNGDAIPEVKDNDSWKTLTTGAFCEYDNSANNGAKYGKLYNWHAVNDNRNLAPAGWHIPSVNEWLVLQNYLISNGFNFDGSNDIDKISKSLCSTTDWAISSNAGAPGNQLSKNNKTGFNGLPAGGRLGSSGTFFGLGESTFWWTSSNSSGTTAYYQAIFNAYSFLGDYSDLKTSGRSIRCLKSDIPTVITNSPTAITSNTAVSGGNVTSDGKDAVIVRGVCWNTNANPTINNNTTMNGNGLGEYTSSLTKLLPGTTYYVRAFATNHVGTAYGQEFSFTTLATIPTVSTKEISEIRVNTATISGVILTNGGASISKKGICWSTKENPDINDSITNGLGDSIFISNLTGLNPGTKYYARAFAVNNIGIAYGDQITFTTLNLPSVTTASITEIKDSTATGGGEIVSNGGIDITEKGICWSTNENPTISDNISVGIGDDKFISNITGLNPGTAYYVRAYATNIVGTAYGAQIAFTTLNLPSVSTASITEIKDSTAIGGGEIVSNGGVDITEKGICWSINENPTISDNISIGIGEDKFISNITGLNPGTVYYARAYATNIIGTAYGSQISFTTLNLPTVSTTSISEITDSTAIGGGEIVSNGGTEILEKGLCWSTNVNPTISDNNSVVGNGEGIFTSNIVGLISDTVYYVRAYAKNSVGTSYGNEISFTTLKKSTE